MEASSPCFQRGSWNIYKTDHILGDKKNASLYSPKQLKKDTEIKFKYATIYNLNIVLNSS